MRFFNDLGTRLKRNNSENKSLGVIIIFFFHLLNYDYTVNRVLPSRVIQNGKFFLFFFIGNCHICFAYFSPLTHGACFWHYAYAALSLPFHFGLASHLFNWIDVSWHICQLLLTWIAWIEGARKPNQTKVCLWSGTGSAVSQLSVRPFCPFCICCMFSFLINLQQSKSAKHFSIYCGRGHCVKFNQIN